MAIRKFFIAVLVGAAGSLVAAVFQQAPLEVLFCGFMAMLISLVVMYFAMRFPRFFGRNCTLCATSIVFKGNEVLLVYHPRHKKWLLPGAHLESNQHPHQAAIEAVKREAGYAVAFHEWHDLQINLDRLVVRVPQPWSVLLEKQFPGEGHEYHYDLFYICVADEDCSANGGQHDHKWVSVSELVASDFNTYPDIVNLVIRAYDFVQQCQN